MGKLGSLCIVVGMIVALASCGPSASKSSASSSGRESGTIAIKGTVSAAQSKNKRGQEVTVASIAVTEAKTADGTPIGDLNGKTILTNRRDGEEVLKYEGKEVIATGSIDPTANGVFRVETVKNSSASAQVALPR